MATRPNNEQIKMVMKSLQLVNHSYLFAHYFLIFKVLIRVGDQVKNAIDDNN